MPTSAASIYSARVKLRRVGRQAVQLTGVVSIVLSIMVVTPRWSRWDKLTSVWYTRLVYAANGAPSSIGGCGAGGPRNPQIFSPHRCGKKAKQAGVPKTIAK